jgi:hypothetical protein
MHGTDLTNGEALLSAALKGDDVNVQAMTKQALPVISVGVLMRNIPVGFPLLEQHRSRVLPLEEMIASNCWRCRERFGG